METAKPKAKPKTPPTKRKSRAAKLSKEQVLIALQKKKECSARAQKIIEDFLDPIPAEKIDYFLSSLIYLNQSHYDDIVEERFITKLCGYPLCDITICEVPKQQFTISIVQNKVYDITDRKKFCSNKCYKSSTYLKEQILTTPLWVRKDDDIIPEFKLLSFDDRESVQEKHKEKESEKNNDGNKTETNANETSTNEKTEILE